MHFKYVIQSLIFDYVYITFQLGIAIVNDFKSIEGDRVLGLQVPPVLHCLLPFCNTNYCSSSVNLLTVLEVAFVNLIMLFGQSIPVAFGAETAKWICVGAIDITQISVAGKSFFPISSISIY